MMKKIVILIIGLVFLMSTVDAKQVDVKPVVLITECNVLAPDGITYITPMPLGKEVIKMNDKVTITCKGKLPEGMAKPKRTLHFNYANTGLLYQTDQFSFNNGLTMDWKQVIKPNGNFKLKATIDISPPTIPTIKNHDNEVEDHDDDLENDD